jgi:serine/threonine protein kinase
MSWQDAKPESPQNPSIIETQNFGRSFPNISGYKILKLLGSGGMGSVYLAEDKILGRQVALKVVSEKVIQSEILLPASYAKLDRWLPWIIPM